MTQVLMTLSERKCDLEGFNAAVAKLKKDGYEIEQVIVNSEFVDKLPTTFHYSSCSSGVNKLADIPMSIRSDFKSYEMAFKTRRDLVPFYYYISFHG